MIDKNWKTSKRKSTNELLQYVFDYIYSSIKEYTNNKFKIVDPEPFPKYFEKISEHKKELFEWLDSNNKENI